MIRNETPLEAEEVWNCIHPFQTVGSNLFLDIVALYTDVFLCLVFDVDVDEGV